MFNSGYMLVILGDVYICYTDHNIYIYLSTADSRKYGKIRGGGCGRGCPPPVVGNFCYFLVKMVQSGAILRQNRLIYFQVPPFAVPIFFQVPP